MKTLVFCKSNKMNIFINKEFEKCLKDVFDTKPNDSWRINVILRKYETNQELDLKLCVMMIRASYLAYIQAL